MIDRLAMHVLFGTYVIVSGSLPTLWWVLLARDLAQGPTALRALKRRSVVVGGSVHKAVGLGAAVAGGLLVANNHVPEPLTVVIVAAVVWSTSAYVLRATGSVIGFKPSTPRSSR